MAEMSMTKPPGRTYRFFDGPVVYPFGFGLSYTSFTYDMIDDPSIITAFFESTEAPGMAPSPQPTTKANFRVRVTNTGSRYGDVSVLAFISFFGDDVGKTSNGYQCPQKQLFDFQKIGRNGLPGR